MGHRVARDVGAASAAKGTCGRLARCRGIAGVAGSHRKHFIEEGAKAREVAEILVVAEPYVATGR
jgi:hypothetical protein